MAAGDLLHQLRHGSGMRVVNRPDKLLLHNPNLFHVLCAQPEPGSLRESFFVSQVSHAHQVHAHDQGDFLIDEQWVFEVGGAGKDASQLGSQHPAYLAVDDLECGHQQRIPLWMFGLLY